MYSVQTFMANENEARGRYPYSIDMLGPRGQNVDDPHSLRWPNVGQRNFARVINVGPT